MILVIDSSAGAETVLRRKQSSTYTEYIAQADQIIAPTLYISEITNVFWKYHAFSNMKREVCIQAIRYAIAIPDEYVHELNLFADAFDLSCKSRLPVYDMYFLALAKRHDASLMTLDKKLKNIASLYSVKTL